tara:strand:+ start:301 stop:579 length:279 start_codon:yes stop_codon:yes gene_type:complete
MNNINASEKNTKKELLDIINRLKKTEILDMIDNYNKVNNKVNNEKTSNEKVNKKVNSHMEIEKKKIKVPKKKNLNKIQFNPRKQDNEAYNNN